MTTITIKQPWAWLICNGLKNVENRSWKLPKKFLDQRILIHASADKSLDKMPLDSLYTNDQLAYLRSLYTEYELCKMTFVHGAIIGAIHVVGCESNDPSIWSIEGQYQWRLKYPQLFDEPIPVKGRLGFWDYPNILAEPEEEGGELFCHCQLPVEESNQVYSMIDHYRCRYCGGRWYK